MFENIDFEIEMTPTCYFKLSRAYYRNEITENEFAFYCMAYLKDLMFLHRNVLENLEER